MKKDTKTVKQSFYEKDMFLPVKTYLQAQGYGVNAEVNSCDVTAVKDNELLIVELKMQFNLKLIFQAIDRQKLTDNVYVCIPRPKTKRGQTYRNMLNLLKRLGIGLMIVALDSPMKTVEIVVPAGQSGANKNKRRVKKLMTEINGRTIDKNVGGTTGVKVMTAYRERAIKIACILEQKQELSAKHLMDIYGCDADTYTILYHNPYGWFEKRRRGIYGLTPKAIKDLEEKNMAHLVTYYRNCKVFSERNECKHEI